MHENGDEYFLWDLNGNWNGLSFIVKNKGVLKVTVRHVHFKIGRLVSQERSYRETL